jgi:uncharacterized lipoprotein YbaY/heat shock protein HslJ
MENVTLTLRRLLVLALLLSATACREPATPNSSTPDGQPANTAVVSGTISYRERLALTDRARAEITLEDVSRQDVAAPVLARQVLTAPGQVPIRFELEFQPAEIDERMAYAVRAKIYDRGRLLFTTDTHAPVLTRGAGREAHLLLVAVEGSAEPGRAAPADVANVEIKGMFRYLADAALLRDCRDGRSYPVAMEAEYIELERAYLNSGINAGQEVYVQLTGRFEERPAMEGNANEVNLIVAKFENIHPDGSCDPAVPAELRDTYWKLLEVDGRQVAAPEGGPEAHLILATEESRVTGHAGCNRFFGSFEVSGDRLGFSALGSTMMACPEGMQTERAFLQALGEANRYAISRQILTLFADDRALARLEAADAP